MTRETWMRDLRIVDDIVIRTGEAKQNDSGLLWHCLYGLAVAVWHLLEDKVRNG